MANAPLHYQTITEVAEQIRSRRVSPTELTELMLERIAALDGQLRSYATVMADQAMAAAQSAEAEIAAGRYRSPLHGVPVAVKDLCFTAGVPTMGGAQVLRDFVPDFDGTVVRRLSEAGAIILGKLNLTEGAMAGYNPAFDIPLNPWAPDRWAGASSSGSGVATAAGLCYGSLGSDTGGSIRFPAAACGTVGIKPTWGRVSRHGVLALAESLDHVGPMTRSAADAGIMLQALAGQDPSDPTSLHAPVPDMLAGVGSGVEGVRIGVDERYIGEDVDAEVAEATMAGARLLEGMGARLVTVHMPDILPFSRDWGVLCSAEAAAAHRDTYPSRADEYGPWFRGWLEKGRGYTALEYAVANQGRLACNGILAEVFSDIDLLVCPSMTTPPGRVTPEELYGPMTEDEWTWGRFTIPYDFNGAPTISLPAGLNSEGLPLSIQFVGKHLTEPLLVRIGDAYEKATRYDLRPPA
ncbi:MAG: amidase [Dehalococcoidia bacterium]|nr:amidase [Dehalococcoidia bacterium]